MSSFTFSGGINPNVTHFRYQLQASDTHCNIIHGIICDCHYKKVEYFHPLCYM